MESVSSHAVNNLTGSVAIPGDKSISHRAVMLGAMALGTTNIHNLLEGQDVLSTVAALRSLGADITRQAPGEWQVTGIGTGGWSEPDQVLDMGNSGTSARLLAGLVATTPITVFMTGDESLRRRPMGRVITPLSLFGTEFLCRAKDKLPLAVTGASQPLPVSYELPIASAQVKSAILFAALNTPGHSEIIELWPSRDHSEHMLQAFGARLSIASAPRSDAPQARIICLEGVAELTAQNITVPGDISSAAFFIVAATLVPNSEIFLPNIGLNPLRTGLLDVLEEMGADITISNARISHGEKTGDLAIRSAELKAVSVPPEIAPRMIDEYPILAVAAAHAAGVTRLEGLRELRVKESDRLAKISEGLKSCGIRVEETKDSLTIHGRQGQIPGEGYVRTALDHRIAMAFLVLGLVAKNKVTIDQAAPIATSFPAFIEKLSALSPDQEIFRAEG